jgi:hypothetical protein
LAENFRQLAEHEAPQQIHLEEPVGAFGIPLRKEEIVLVPCQDVRNAAIVAQNRNRSAQSQAGYRSGLSRVYAHADGGVDDESENRERGKHRYDENQPKKKPSHKRSDVDEDVVALNAYWERHQRHHGRKRKRIAGEHVEGRTVARTDDALTFERPLVERAAVVRTDVLDAVNRPADVTKQNLA